MDQVMAALYKSAGKGGSIFNLPGQNLEDKAGVTFAGKTTTEKDNGGLEVLWKFRTKKASLFTTESDSLDFKIDKKGWWVYYTYQESILSSDSRSEPMTAGDGYRFRQSLVLPGQIIEHSADSVIKGCLIWNRGMAEISGQGLIMKAKSREINPKVLFPLAVLFVFAVGFFIYNCQKTTGKGYLP
jgi:hypothetical protein